jgi:hypothetical protein
MRRKRNYSLEKVLSVLLLEYRTTILAANNTSLRSSTYTIAGVISIDGIGYLT